MLSPWWAHNWYKYDGFVKLNLSGGYHLYSGNNPENLSGGGIGGTDVNHGSVSYTHLTLPTKA